MAGPRDVGRRSMMPYARKLSEGDVCDGPIQIAIEDITERRDNTIRAANDT